MGEAIARVDGWSEGNDGQRLTTWQLIDSETGESMYIGTVETVKAPKDEVLEEAVQAAADEVVADPEIKADEVASIEL